MSTEPRQILRRWARKCAEPVVDDRRRHGHVDQPHLLGDDDRSPVGECGSTHLACCERSSATVWCSRSNRCVGGPLDRRGATHRMASTGGRAVALRWFDAMRSDDPPSRRFSSVLLAALWTLALLLGAPAALPPPGAAVGTHGEIAAEESRGGDLVASRDRATAERRNLRLRRRKAHRVGRCRRLWGCDWAALALAAVGRSSPLRGPPLRALT